MSKVERQYLAHPAIPQFKVAAQTYKDHAEGVCKIASHRCEEMLRYYFDQSKIKLIRNSVIDFAMLHDIGKLHEDWQNFVHNGCVGPRINHVDAGGAICLHLFRKEIEKLVSKKLPRNYSRLLTVLLIQGHHIGLLNSEDLCLLDDVIKDPVFMRDTRDLHKHIIDPTSKRVMDFVDKDVSKILKIHEDLTGSKYTVVEDPKEYNLKFASLENPNFAAYQWNKVTALDLRLVASCCYYADHTDTAKASGGANVDHQYKGYGLRALERMNNLDATYYANFNQTNDARSLLRQQVYADATNVTIEENDKYFLLDASVGANKTLAGLKFALRVAEQFKLRRIFTFAPFTGIIDQMLNVYRQYLLLDDEKNAEVDEVIAGHHHLADYGKKSKTILGKQFAKAVVSNWHAPVTLTTVEQLIDSFASNKVPRLKKLNNVPGSMLIIEEFHKIPMEIWPWLLAILHQLVDKWGCKILFVSGTPVNPWEIASINPHFTFNVKRVVSAETALALASAENNRVTYNLINSGRSVAVEDLVQTMIDFAGSKLCICNTTQNAAVVAQLVANAIGWDRVIYVSTALAPSDRRAAMLDAKKKLADKESFLLVGTSCIEAGLDVSFDTAYIEARSVDATTQGGGRVNRNHVVNHSIVNVFQLAKHPFLTELTSVVRERDILIRMMRANSQLTMESARASYQLLAQSKDRKIIKNAEHVLDLEKKFNLDGVRREVRMISHSGYSFIVNPYLVELLNDAEPTSRFDLADLLGLESGKKITSGWINKMIQNHSFSINVSDEAQLQKKGFPYINLSEYWEQNSVVPENDENQKQSFFDKIQDELLGWFGSYDNKLGYMNHVLADLGVPGCVRSASPLDAIKEMFK